MHLRRLVTLTLLPLLAFLTCGPTAAQSDGTQATFKSGVDLVSVAATVRDKKGRVVRSLTSRDFIVTDEGQRRTIIGLQADEGSPANLALLVDGSGSMKIGTSTDASRLICHMILTRLRREQDRAALMSFDTRLLTLREFTAEFDRIQTGLGEVNSFGSTSIYDAIAGTAAAVAKDTQKRRAVVVITDGWDNASRYTPQEVAAIASTIDVPVYVFAVGDLNPEVASEEKTVAERQSDLFELARATGGDHFFSGSPSVVHQAATRLLDELHHQYLIAFEPATASGLRKIDVRTRDDDHNVRSRRWYSAAN
jgi:Ca-activated chloride channel family protein